MKAATAKVFHRFTLHHPFLLDPTLMFKSGPQLERLGLRGTRHEAIGISDDERYLEVNATPTDPNLVAQINVNYARFIDRPKFEQDRRETLQRVKAAQTPVRLNSA